MNFQQCNAVLFNEKIDSLTQGGRDLTQEFKEMCLAKTKLEQNKYFPQSNNSPSNLFSQLINSLGIRKMCFPIILPWENIAGGWKLTSTAQHTQGRPGKRSCLPSFQGARAALGAGV